MASAIYAKREAQISKEERFMVKTTSLGARYGMGATKFQTQIKAFGTEISAQGNTPIINTNQYIYLIKWTRELLREYFY